MGQEMDIGSNLAGVDTSQDQFIYNTHSSQQR